MIKSALAAVVAAPFLATSALAGPYVNLETNAGFVGNDYQGALTEYHVGYEGPIGESAAWYIQGGPATSHASGADTEVEGSGKVGVGIDVTESLNVYGEVAVITSGEFDLDEDLAYGTKLGVKYSF
jgi:hypothetical protein